VTTQFNTACLKNFAKLSLVTIAVLASTLGLRTELTIILGDVFIATWCAIAWVLIMIAVLSYYKAKTDVELEVFRENERNRHLLGLPPIGTNNAIYSEDLKPGQPVFLRETE
jgi:hypothetical protein